jgi:DNA-binding IclR family transcriptional regulator
MARTIKPIIKTLAILKEIVGNQCAALTLTEILQHIGTPKSSAHPIHSNLLT